MINRGAQFWLIAGLVLLVLGLAACSLLVSFDWFGVRAVLPRAAPIIPKVDVVAKANTPTQEPVLTTAVTFPPTSTLVPSVLPPAQISTSTSVPTRTRVVTQTENESASRASNRDSREDFTGDGAGRSLLVPPYSEVIELYDPFRLINLADDREIDFYQKADRSSAVLFSVGPLPYPQPVLVDALVRGFDGTLFYEQCYFIESNSECEPLAYFLAIHGRRPVPTPSPTPTPTPPPPATIWDFSVTWQEVDSGDPDTQKFERVLHFIPSGFEPSYVVGPEEIEATLCSEQVSWTVTVYKWTGGISYKQKTKSGEVLINCPKPPYYQVLPGYPMYANSLLQPLTEGVNLRTKPFVTKATQKYLVGQKDRLQPLRLVEADDFGKGNPYWWQIQYRNEILYVHWSTVVEVSTMATPVPTPTTRPTPVATPQSGEPVCAVSQNPPLQLCVSFTGGYSDEWVMIRNLSGFSGFGPGRPIDFTSYRLTDYDGNVFDFTGNAARILGPSEILYVVTNEERDGVFRGASCPNCYSWHTRLPTGTPRTEIWEDRGDIVKLYNAQGELFLEMRYGLGQTPYMLQLERQERSIR